MSTDSGTFTFRYGGREFCFCDYDAADHINAVMRRTQSFYELAMLEDIASRVFFPCAVVDVGSHIGNHSVFFAGVLDAEVIAIEPNPASRETLARNLALNHLGSRVDVKACAAGARAARGTLIPGPPTNTGQTQVDSSQEGDIEITPLDQLVRRPIQLLKIDVEGSVQDVLLGAARVISQDRPLIYAEVDAEGFPRVRQHLDGMGYVAWKRFNHTPTILFLPCERFQSNGAHRSHG